MEITLNVTEDSKVELVKDSCEAVQGEHNVTILNINFPNTIKGYSIDNYTKQIEFAECKELGECVKFMDEIEGNTYKLCSICTQFKKIMVQFTLKNLVDEAEPIVWKSVPFMLEFCESVNAENSKEVQATLLSLAEIKKEWTDDLGTTKDEWEAFIKANTLRMIYRVGDVPTANEESKGDTIFYLGANSTAPYVLTYGHYYRCNYVIATDTYEWTDLTIDPNLADVANGIRELNSNQTMQIWAGETEELENEVIKPNVIYLPLDFDIKAEIDEVLTEIDKDEKYNLGVFRFDENGVLKVKKYIMPVEEVLNEEDMAISGTGYTIIWTPVDPRVGKLLKVYYDINGQERFITITPNGNSEVSTFDIINNTQRVGVSDTNKNITTFTNYKVTLKCTAFGQLSISSIRNVVTSSVQTIQVTIAGESITRSIVENSDATYEYPITVKRIVQVIK